MRPLLRTSLADLASDSLLSPVDPEVIESLRSLDDGGDAFLAEIVGVFLADSPGRLAAIRCAGIDNASRELADLAHALKGDARTLGLLRLAAVCHELETRANAGERPGEVAHRRLDEEYAAATEALASLGLREAH